MTLLMNSYSYYTAWIAPGAVMMFLMDVSDIFVAIFKLSADISEVFMTVSFLSMLSSWIYLRLWYFPYYLIAAC